MLYCTIERKQEVVVMNKISEVARMFNITTRTIRYYEEIGILKPVRTSTNERLFPESEITKLKLVARGKRYGFTLAEIKELVLLFEQDNTGKQQLERAIKFGSERIKDIEQKIADLQQTKKEMERLLKEFAEKLDSLKEES